MIRRDGEVESEKELKCVTADGRVKDVTSSRHRLNPLLVTAFDRDGATGDVVAMYFPNGVARVLSQSPGDEPILSISANPRKSLFLTTTASTISLWRVRVRGIYIQHVVNNQGLIYASVACHTPRISQTNGPLHTQSWSQCYGPLGAEQ